MSKNIYRVNKRIKLDEIITKNYYKPICIIFMEKNKNKEDYKNME